MREDPDRASGPMTGAVIERVSAEDLMQLAADIGPVPWQAGAILEIEAGPEFDTSAAADVIAGRVRTVPRLRQVLVHPPRGCGRPVWIDDAGFDVRHHLRTVACPPPGDEAALLGVAVDVVTERLPLSRPLWSATFVTGLTGSRAALVVAMHHVLADGIGGLAALGALADGASAPARVPFPRPAPSRRQLMSEAWHSRLAAIAPSTAGWRRLRHALVELDPASAVRAPRTTLNQPTGRRRRLAVARAELAPVRDLAHARGATVNDVVLAAVIGALGALLARRGEIVDGLVVSVPVSARTSSATSELGNRVGVMPVWLPLCSDRAKRLEHIAGITRARKTVGRGASAIVLGPAFRILAAAGVLSWFTNRQRLVNVFETNLRGPDHQLTLAGNRVTQVLPVTGITGNVATSFAAMSYSGTLAVVVVADPDLWPDLGVLATLLQRELNGLATDLPRS